MQQVIIEFEIATICPFACVVFKLPASFTNAGLFFFEKPKAAKRGQNNRKSFPALRQSPPKNRRIIMDTVRRAHLAEMITELKTELKNEVLEKGGRL